MRLGGAIKVMGLGTILSLVYIHMQVQIINLAYQGKQKEKRIRELVDENGNIEYSILSLKSSINLGEKILGDDSDMQFVHPGDIIQLSVPDLPTEGTSFRKVSKAKKKSKPLLSFIPLGTEAEAKGW